MECFWCVMASGARRLETICVGCDQKFDLSCCRRAVASTQKNLKVGLTGISDLWERDGKEAKLMCREEVVMGLGRDGTDSLA